MGNLDTGTHPGRVPREDEGRGTADEPTSQGTPKPASKERVLDTSSLKALSRRSTADTLHSNSWTPDLGTVSNCCVSHSACGAQLGQPEKLTQRLSRGRKKSSGQTPPGPSRRRERRLFPRKRRAEQRGFILALNLGVPIREDNQARRHQCPRVEQRNAGTLTASLKSVAGIN